MGRLSRILWERHKNPLSWVLRPVFAVVLIYGVWFHDWDVIGIAVFGLSTSWFWFPKPKKIPTWAEKFIDKEGEWMQNLRRGSLKEVGWSVFAIVVMGIWIYTIWSNNLAFSLIMTGFIIGAKFIWSAMLERSVAKPLTILVSATYFVSVIVLALLILYL